MPKIRYRVIDFRPASLKLIRQANEIIAEYQAQGFDLTLRQLYYQCVARGILKNTQQSYKSLGGIVNDARLAGLIDWERIEDRTRGVESVGTWRDPQGIVSACADQFKLDLWEGQPRRVEVWIEKEALAGVFARVCEDLRVAYLSCRGYTSQSEMWRAGMRLRRLAEGGTPPTILHFGDHDPSGIDMSRDIQDRLQLFMGQYADDLEFRRLALNMDQVLEYSPPPNPAKVTDSRFEGYQREYGDESWELDALDPATLAGLVRTEVESLREQGPWDAMVGRENEARRLLGEVAASWDSLTEGL